MRFTHKGYGRIYVAKEEDIPKVHAIIKEMDEFEYNYLPNNFITTFSHYPILQYTGKFDDLDFVKLTARCWQRGIYIFCVDNGSNEYIMDDILLVGGINATL